MTSILNRSLCFVILFTIVQSVNAQCLGPTSFNISNIGITKAQVNVVAGYSGSWQVEYGITGFSHGNGKIESFNSSSFVLTNLQPGTVYDSYIRESCDVNQFSSWIGPVQFTTGDLFTKINITSTGLGLMEGNSKWGDFDKDGDLDIISTGTSSLTSYHTAIYRNTGGVFSDVGASLPQLRYAFADWGDYDNDGDLDLFLSGFENGNILNSKVYRNDNGIFTDIKAGLIGLYNVRGKWCDLDNDGKIDLILSGRNQNYDPLTVIYKNISNDNFERVEISLNACSDGSLDVGDYNNDGFLDIIMTGADINANAHTTLYQNKGDMNFVQVNTNFTKTREGIVKWVDYDGDGDLDISLCGYGTNSYSYYFKLYSNDASGSFVDISVVSSISIKSGSAEWADYDNDGDQDMLVIGLDHQNNYSITLLRNDKNAIFTSINGKLPAVDRGYLSWGDYDLDGDLDLLFQGIEKDATWHFELYRNNLNTINSAPTVPSGIGYWLSNKKVYLKLGNSTDNETPSGNLTYNVYVGSAPGKSDIISSNYDATHGTLLTPDYGRSRPCNWMAIAGLKPGTYYWGVQAIDNSFKTSSFTTEETFIVPPDFSPNIFDSEIAYLTAAASGDYNNDGFLDVIISGISSWPDNKVLTKLFANNGNFTFTQIDAGIENLNKGAMAWGDYDNDGDLDLLIAGVNSSNVSKTIIYRNDGANIFTNINANLTGVSYGSVAWGDYDNDGDLDALVGGGGTAKLYRNDGNDTFSQVSTSFMWAYFCTVCFGDYDNDLDLDIFVIGAQPSVYKNNGQDSFSRIPIASSGLSSAYSKVVDYDNDNDLDIILCGRDNDNNFLTKIYRNDKNDVFTYVPSTLRGLGGGFVDAADYNVDGKIDILVAGNSGSSITQVYKGKPDYTFENIGADLKGNIETAGEWGDFNSDSNIDILLTGDNSDNLIYKNNLNYPNSIPYAPSNLTSTRSGYGIILGWSKATDPNCDSNGLTYNIRIGKTSGGYEIVSPMSNLITGIRNIPKSGNAEYNLGWRIDSLPVGTYYWSVQAVDQGFFGSLWAPEQTFTITTLTASFSASNVCKGNTTVFTDLSVWSGSPINTWNWDFGDGATANVQTPTHTYSSSGEYNVKLVITSTSGDKDSLQQTVVVREKPSVAFTAPTICQGTPSTITNTTDAKGLTINSWYWNFGDGQTSTDQQPTPHGYLSAGQYPVKLIALAENGCKDSTLQTVSVASYPSAIIIANAPLTFCKGDSVSLSVQSSSNYDYMWLESGVAMSNGTSSTYAAKLTGIYSIEVINRSGNCKSVSNPVTVNVLNSPTAPLITYNGSTVFCQGDSLMLSVSATDDATFHWKLNGGGYNGSTNSLYAKSSGTYTVDITNANGCKVSSVNSVLVTVKENPTLPTVNQSGPTTFCEGASVTLIATLNPAYNYQWRNDNITLTNMTSNTYTATTSGNYSLQVSNAQGCITQTSPIQVSVKPMASKPEIVTENYQPNQCPNLKEVKLKVEQPVAEHNYIWKRNGVEILSESTDMLVGYLPAGDYSVEANLEGCKNESSIKTLTYEATPEKPSIVARGPNVWYLVCDNTTASAYRWYYNGSQIPGADRNAYVANKNLGVYIVSVANDKGCFTSSDPLTIPITSTNIDENSDDFIRIFPNPTDENITIEIDQAYNHCDVEVIDIKGALKIQKHASNNAKLMIDLSTLPNGVYFCKILFDSKIAIKKIIKQKSVQ